MVPRHFRGGHHTLLKIQRDDLLWLAMEPYLPQRAGASFPKKVSGLRDSFFLPKGHRLTSPPFLIHSQELVADRLSHHGGQGAGSGASPASSNRGAICHLAGGQKHELYLDIWIYSAPASTPLRLGCLGTRAVYSLSSVAAVTTAIFPMDTSKEPVIFKKGSAFVPHQLHHTHQSGLTLIGGRFLQQGLVRSIIHFVRNGLNYAEV